MGSTRLPGKALLKIAGKTPIEWIVERLKYAHEVDEVVLITSSNPENDPLIPEASRLGIRAYREPSETDLVSRYLNAINLCEADTFVRVTADCPLVDVALVDQLVRVYREDPEAYDAYTNVIPPTFPDGSDLDVIPRATLEKLHRDIPAGDIHREWVTPYLYKQDRGFRIYALMSERPLQGYRITLDYPEDLELINKVFEHFGDQYAALPEVIRYLDEHPEAQDLVKQHLDTTLVQASNQRSGAYQKLIDTQKGTTI